MASAHGADGLASRQIVDTTGCDSIFPTIFYRKVEGVDEFLKVQAELKGPGTTGWWDEVIPALTDQQRESLMQAAESKAISHRAISIVLGKWGHAVKPGMVGHWRRTYVR